LQVTDTKREKKFYRTCLAPLCSLTPDEEQPCTAHCRTCEKLFTLPLKMILIPNS